MTSAEELAVWHEKNDAYLGAAVAWLRILLMRHAPPAPAVVPTDARGHSRSTPMTYTPEESSPWWKFGRSGASTESATASPPLVAQLALPPGSSAVSQETLDEAHRRMLDAEAVEPVPALASLTRRFNLSPFERDVLLLCVAMELDTSIAPLCARAQDDPGVPFPTFGLCFTLFDSPGWDARSPEHPLRYWRLIDLNQPWGQALTVSPLRADERIVNYVKGLSHVDDRLAPFIAPLTDGSDEELLPESQRAVVDEIISTLRYDVGAVQPIQLTGRDSGSCESIAAAVAHKLGLTLYRMDAASLPAPPADLDTVARLWQRETLLLPIALYIDASDIEPTNEQHSTSLRRFLARAGGLIFVENANSRTASDSGVNVFDVEKPTAAEQRELWADALGQGNEAEASSLAAAFSLGARNISRIAAEAQADDAEIPLGRRVRARAARHTRLRIDNLAQRIEPKATWNDIVLPAPEEALLREIAAHVDGRGQVYDEWGFRQRMNRGFGISAIFAGASGTGKTMAAEVIANDLGVSLHRIDLSAVVSKWVGETEKNLQQLFNAADDASGILFFDEADALFGKRTEVQQSQDRFANIEINFLLQRLEAYRGLAILATNMLSALDPSFTRRVRFIVKFPVSGPREQRAIWERAFPAKTPTADLDFDRLAKLNLTGGSIHNVALSAAFLAAKRGMPVTMPIVLEAAKTEMRKIDRPVHEPDFRWSERPLELSR